MTLTIGELARAAGVNVQTVRYYERRGILAEPPRTTSGYRQYDPGAADRILFVRRAQDLGFTLEEIGELLSLRVEHSDACPAVEAKAAEKLRAVEAKIAELESLRDVLGRLIRACRRREATAECPILEALRDDSGA